MNADTTNAVLAEQEGQLQWEKPFLFPVGAIKVNLSVAMRNNAMTPPGATNQPKIFPTSSRYLFHPSIYNGVAALKQLTNDLQSCCPGCVLYPCCSNNGTISASCVLRCSHYFV